MNRLGTVIVFKKGATEEAVAKALRGLADVLDLDYMLPKSELLKWGHKDTGLVLADDGDRVMAKIETFDDAHGGPVFYLP